MKREEDGVEEEREEDGVEEEEREVEEEGEEGDHPGGRGGNGGGEGGGEVEMEVEGAAPRVPMNSASFVLHMHMHMHMHMYRLEEEAVQTALAERAQAIEARAARLKEECTLAAKKEKKERYQDTMAQSIMFSYFSFLPPPTTRKPTDKRTQRGKRPQTIRSK